MDFTCNEVSRSLELKLFGTGEGGKLPYPGGVVDED